MKFTFQSESSFQKCYFLLFSISSQHQRNIVLPEQLLCCCVQAGVCHHQIHVRNGRDLIEKRFVELAVIRYSHHTLGFFHQHFFGVAVLYVHHRKAVVQVNALQ